MPPTAIPDQVPSIDDRPILDAIYDSVTSGAAYGRMLELLCRRFDCISAAIFYLDPARREANITAAHGLLADTALVDRYQRDFAGLDPAPRAMAALPLGQVASTDDLFQGAERAGHTRFLDEFYHPAGLGGALGGPLANDRGQVGFVAVHRAVDRARFSAGEVEAFRALMPHLVRAIELRRAFIEIATLAEQVEAGSTAAQVGILAFWPNGILRHANPTARALLARTEGLLLDAQGRLRATDAETQRALQALMSGPISPERSNVLVVRRRSDGRPISTLRVLPPRLSAEAGRTTGPVVVISDPQRQPRDPEPLLRTVFGFSADCARLVAALLAGDELRSYAKRVGVSVNTVKYHLQRAFELTGTRRQSDLVRLALMLTRDVA